MKLYKTFTKLQDYSFYMIYYSDFQPQWDPIFNAFIWTWAFLCMGLLSVWVALCHAIKHFYVGFELDVPVMFFIMISSLILIIVRYLYKGRYKKIFVILDGEDVDEFNKEKNKVLWYCLVVVLLWIATFLFFPPHPIHHTPSVH